MKERNLSVSRFPLPRESGSKKIKTPLTEYQDIGFRHTRILPPIFVLVLVSRYSESQEAVVGLQADEVGKKGMEGEGSGVELRCALLG